MTIRIIIINALIKSRSQREDSRTEPENAKTGGQDLSPSARWPRTEFIYVFI